MGKENALKILRELHNKSLFSERTALETFIPELKESEDEKVEKAIFGMVYDSDNELWSNYDVSKSDVLAWLGKQDEFIRDTDTEYFNEESLISDNDKQKFNVGDWVTDDGETFFLIISAANHMYQLETVEGTSCHFHQEFIESKFRLWTIQDAKDGDVLSYVTDEEDLWIMIYWSLYEPYEGHVHYHALLVNDNFSDKGTCCICIDNLKPATKEQRDLLFQKMHEADYKWDAEKKKLKKIEDEEYDGEDYGIDSLFHAQRILEKTLGKVNGYQTDDGILEHKCAITAVNKLYKHKTSWSGEDEEMFKSLKTLLNNASCYSCTEGVDKILSWLKSFKNRVIPQPKQEWSEEDEKKIDSIIETIRIRKFEHPQLAPVYDGDIDWLKSLRPQK